MGKTSIEWTRGDDGAEGRTWNCLRGCSRVSPGCGGGTPGPLRGGCYAEGIAERFSGPGQPFEGFAVRGKGWTRKVALLPEKLAEPLGWKKPARIFVNSMSDIFHEGLSDQDIDQILAVMVLAPHHTYQVLTKRAGRMRSYLSDPRTPGRVARAADRMAVQIEIAAMGPERIVAIDGFDGYFVSDRGRVLTSGGSASCVHCGASTDGIAKQLYCSKKCEQNACYHRRVGHPLRFAPTLKPLSPDVGEQGHSRVTFYQEGATPQRQLVHRLVLAAFVRPPLDEEQGCHRDGDATNNALPNLRWGTQGDNWMDRARHGNARSWSKLTLQEVHELRLAAARGDGVLEIASTFDVSEATVRSILAGHTWAQDGIPWPLQQLWAGVSVEDQQRANERIPYLLETPAAVHFVSAEPLLGAVDLSPWLTRPHADCNGCTPEATLCDGHDYGRALSWVIVGGESGHGARPFALEWARRIILDCAAAKVACFMKQAGARPTDGGELLKLTSKKGGDLDELPGVWPRQFPSTKGSP